MCTRFVYNGKETIVGFNFDIDHSEWEHTVIAEKDRFFLGIKMSDNKYHSFHGINRNGNVGTLLYVHGNDNAQFCGNESCYTIADLTENFIKGNLSFDDSLEIVKKKKITYAPDTTMQAMFSDRTGRVLIIEPGIGYRLEKEKYSLITNYSILKPELTNPYVLSGDNRYEKAKDLLQGYGENFSISNAFDVLRSFGRGRRRCRRRRKDFGQPEFLLYIPLLKIRYIMCWTMISKILQSINSNITAIINKSGGFTFPPLP